MYLCYAENCDGHAHAKIASIAAVSLIKDAAGAAVGVITVNRDITARTERAATRQARDERFRHSFACVAIGMAIISPTSFILEANDAICGGKALVEQLGRTDPQIKVLFISGYATDLIIQKWRLANGMHFLAKPFTRADIARKVREVLRAEPHRSTGARHPDGREISTEQ